MAVCLSVCVCLPAIHASIDPSHLPPFVFLSLWLFAYLHISLNLPSYVCLCLSHLTCSTSDNLLCVSNSSAILSNLFCFSGQSTYLSSLMQGEDLKLTVLLFRDENSTPGVKTRSCAGHAQICWLCQTCDVLTMVDIMGPA